MAIGPAQYDFSINTPDVLAEFQKGQNYGQQQALLMQQRQIAQAQAAQQQEMANRVFGIQAKVQNGTATAEDYAQLQTLDPKNSEGYKRAFETMDTGRKSSMFESQVPVYTALQNKRVDVAKNLIAQQIDALKNSVQTPDTMRRLQGAQTALSLIDSGPDGAVQAQMLLGSALQGLDPERFGKIVSNQSAANADQRAQELQGGLVRKGLAEAVQQEAKASTAYQMAQTELVKAGWDIENLKSLIQDRKEGQKVALLNAQIAREGNSIKREELKLKRDEIQEKQADKLRQTAADVSNARGNIDNLLNTVDRIKAHPGTDGVLGSLQGKRDTFLTDEAADAKALIDTLSSQVFLTMASQLKGMGALSEQEGNKVQTALQSLSRQQSPKQFRENADEIQRLMIKARKTVADRYGVPESVPDTPSALPTAGQLQNLITKHGGQ